MIKLFIRNLIFGAVMACAVFVINGIWLDLTGSDGLQSLFDNFTTRALGSMVIGAGFAGSSTVYHFERLALWLQIFINMFVGFGVYFIVGTNIGLISIESPSTIILGIAINTLIFVAIALGYYLLNVREAKVINKKLKELESNQKKRY